MAAMLAEAQALANSAATELGSTPALLFCGDLNSDLNDGMPGETYLLVCLQMHTDMCLDAQEAIWNPHAATILRCVGASQH